MINKVVKKLLSLVISLCIILSTVTIFPVVKADVWNGTDISVSLSGSGTYTDPYLINNGADLAYISKQVSNGNSFEGKYFSVTQDITLNANSSNYESWKNTAPANSFTPIGKYGNAFKGNINGNGYTIYGMYYSDPSSSQQGVGFISFAYLATISNLNIKNSYLCARNYLGGIAGMAQQFYVMFLIL